MSDNLNFLKANYLQRYLDILEKMFSTYDAWDGTTKAEKALTLLNEEYTAAGLPKTELRERLIGENAVNDDGTWYSSNC